MRPWPTEGSAPYETTRHHASPRRMIRGARRMAKMPGAMLVLRATVLILVFMLSGLSTVNECENFGVCSHRSFLRSLDKPVKLLRAGDGIGDGVLAGDDDGRG